MITTHKPAAMKMDCITYHFIDNNNRIQMPIENLDQDVSVDPVL